jgi:hypothetical protein|tara:strand:+ start:323 stop:649 length:327 start_codon:yes stop_codon:yes gene_type:complete
MSSNNNYYYNFSIDGEEVKKVSEDTIKKYYLFVNTKLFHNFLIIFLITGIFIYLSFYIYYSLEIRRLLNEPSPNNPVFHCQNNGSTTPLPCNGRGYYIDPSNNQIKCT